MPAMPPPLELPLTFEVREQTTPTYTATLTDDAGTPLSALNIDTLTLTLYVIQSDGSIAYVNSRNAQDVLNANNVTIYNTLQTRADGTTYNLLWNVQVADTTLVEDLPFERHIALWEWSWLGVTRYGKHEVILNVQNLTEV